jgi:hemerythrin superfamily protein
MGDVIDEVLKDHEEIKKLFAKVESASGKAKEEAFQDLVHKLIVHETAEQEIVHPLLKKGDDESVAEERLAEEKEGEEMLAKLEDMGVDDPKFETTFAQLKADVLDHAEMEEHQEHPRIRASHDADRLKKLGSVFEAAEKIAPTRPHPMGPTSATGNVVVGPFVAIVDRTRDVVRDAMKKLSA